MTPEEITALQEENEALKKENASLKDLTAKLQEEVQRLLATPDEEEKANGVGETFSFEKAKYKILVTAIRIPALGKRTALEILADKEAQKWLVENNSGAIVKVAK